MAIFYLDPEDGNDANDGSTFANRWKTVVSGATGARIAPGDEIRMIASHPKKDSGINATFTNSSGTVTLDSALNTLITDCESSWTASANVTCSTTTARRSGSFAATINIATAFSTGKAAYFDLGSNQDYSAYQGISFWLSIAGTFITAGMLEIRLCSDAVGDVAVDTLPLPTCNHASSTMVMPIYIDKGSALGASIRSIALYVATNVSDVFTLNLTLDHIITVKAKGSSPTDNLNLTSLISAGENGPWYPVRIINGTTVTLDNHSAGTNSAVRGWVGTTGSYDLWLWQPLRYPQTASVLSTELTVQDSGVAGLPITFSGGWNRSDMSAQTGETWLDGGHSFTKGWSGSSRSYINIEKVNMVRWHSGVYLLTGISNWTIGDIRTAGSQDWGLDIVGTNITVGNVEGTTHGSGTVRVSSSSKVTIGNITGYGAQHSVAAGAACGLALSSVRFCKVGNIDARNAANVGVYLEDIYAIKIGTITLRTIVTRGIARATLNGNNYCRVTIGDIDHDGTQTGGLHMFPPASHNCRFGVISAKNGTIGIDGLLPPNCFVKSIVTSGNSSSGWLNAGTALGPNGNTRIKTTNCTDTTPFQDGAVAVGSRSPNGWHAIRNHLNVSGDHRIDFGSHGANALARVTVETGANRHTLSGKAWKIAPLNTVYTALFPLRFPLGKIYCAASALVTLRLWVNRSDTGLTASLVQPGHQIAGVSADVSDGAAASAGVWEELEVTFTPSEAGIIEPEIRAYGGSTFFVYVDDMTVLQA